MKSFAEFGWMDVTWSLSLRRAWIEMCLGRWIVRSRVGRSPYGERGLKLPQQDHARGNARSLSLRRAWIEISNVGGIVDVDIGSLSLRRAWIEICGSKKGHMARPCRSPYGERGLKLQMTNVLSDEACRSPYGERGLKFGHDDDSTVRNRSLSLRRAWIEICSPRLMMRLGYVALLTESVD